MPRGFGLSLIANFKTDRLLGVKLAANGEMTMDQLKLRYNGQPSAETRAMVEGCLAEAFRRRGRNASE